MLGDDWRWCPACRAALDRQRRGGAMRPACPACGFAFFANMGVGVAVVVRNRPGHVLLVEREAKQWGAGQWCLPCGFVEWGEDLREAASREAREEAGLAVTIGDVIQVENNRHEPGKPTIGIWFAATLVDPDAQPVAGDDAAAAAWFALDSLPPLAFPTDVTLLERLRGA